MAQGSGIVLPRLKRVELRGFDPLFDEPLMIALPTGPFLILGGNTLGKTTILQATVYGLAGVADAVVEGDKGEKGFRWGVDYFKKRLDPETDAEIIVEFTLGDLSICVRRSMKNERIRGVRFGRDEWIHDSILAPAAFESAVKNAGNYTSFDDFRYLVHKLCYLAENRRSLLWNQRAQLRVVMLVCGDAGKESSYHETRHALTRADSDRRHCKVDIGHLEARIARLEAATQAKGEHQRQSSSRTSTSERNVRRIEEIQTTLGEMTARRIELLTTVRSTRSSLGLENSQLEELQTQLSRAEDTFVLQVLQQNESSDSALGLHKLLVHHRCPYCTQTTEELARKAKEHLESHECPICGQTQIVPIDSSEVARLRRLIIARSDKRNTQEQEVTELESKLLVLTQNELALRAELDSLAESLPRVPKEGGIELSTNDVASLRRTRLRYQTEHARLQAKCDELRGELNARYEEFHDSCARNLSRLNRLAVDYGVAFLGASCEFVPTQAPGELHDFTFFVPRFADKNREDPKECSESERFFLDIAFRMALIEVAGELAGHPVTFICETPENALDLAYTDNVAEMFRKFSAKSYSLLLTANIQVGGVAFPLLRKYRLLERRRRVLNLTANPEKLSEVQKRKESDFKRELRKIMEKE